MPSFGGVSITKKPMSRHAKSIAVTRSLISHGSDPETGAKSMIGMEVKGIFLNYRGECRS